LALIAGLPSLAEAQPAADVGKVTPPEPPELPHVRLTVSGKANERLIARRLRALLRIQLGDEAEVDSGSVGSLADELIYVWIDVPQPRLALIEVRGHAMELGRRTLAIADFPADVAARVVAIEASEMVRVQAEAHARLQAGPEPPGGGATPLTSDETGIALDGSFDVHGLPSATPSFLLGPTVSLEHRQQFTAQALYLRWHTGVGDASLRWLEVGAGIDIRFALAEHWRLTVGARAGAVVVGLPNATAVDGQTRPDGESDEISARVAGSVGVETQLGPDAWLGLRAEPGAVLRPFDYVVPGPEPVAGAVEGFSMVGALSLRVTPLW